TCMPRPRDDLRVARSLPPGARPRAPARAPAPALDPVGAGRRRPHRGGPESEDGAIMSGFAEALTSRVGVRPRPRRYRPTTADHRRRRARPPVSVDPGMAALGHVARRWGR